MLDPRITELEGLLATANENIVALTKTNTDLKEQISDAERMNKRIRRHSRQSDSVLRTQLTDMQNRRG
jgi:C4-type Zn-finger protein